MSNLVARVNNAINDNPDGSDLNITTHGSDWAYAVCAVMFFSAIVILAWHFTIPRGQRIFHQIAVIILTTAGIAYFAMGSNLGSTPIATEFAHEGRPVGITRAIWYVRYIDWTITTPALLLELVLASGLPLSDIITLIFFDLVMIITGLVGSLIASSYKWGFYTFGCVALFYIWWALLGPARTTAGLVGPEYKKAFTSSAAILAFLWLLYPIAWGLADGGSVIHPDSEMVFYGVLDVLAKPVFCFIHLFALRNVDLTKLQLHSGKFTATAAGLHHADREKSAYENHTHTGVVGSGPQHEATTAASTNAAAPKKGMFGRKGKYDATPATGANGHHNPTNASTIAPTGPQSDIGGVRGEGQTRLSEATATSNY